MAVWGGGCSFMRSALGQFTYVYDLDRLRHDERGGSVRGLEGQVSRQQQTDEKLRPGAQRWSDPSQSLLFA